MGHPARLTAVRSTPARATLCPLDQWGHELAALIGWADVTGEAVLRVPMLADGPDSPQRLRAACAPLEALGIAHLPVLHATDGLWIGPAVVPREPGCVSCWQSRRRQHAGAPRPNIGAPLDAHLAAQAVLAVLRRVLTDPESEAGVVRRLTAGGRAPEIGRVAPVAGCRRCDHHPGHRRRWSLTDAPSTEPGHPMVKRG